MILELIYNFNHPEKKIMRNYELIKSFIFGILIVAGSVFTFLSAEAQENIQSEKVNSASSYYRIGPNDVLSIFIWKEPELTRNVTVMSDGRISYPLIGDIMAEGETVASLKDKITEKMKGYIENPEVTVIIDECRSRRIYIIGQVGHPGPIELEAKMTVLQALASAGGFQDYANKKYILIFRRENNREKMYRFNYQEFISHDNLDQNIFLEPNDTIVVP